MQCLLMIFQDIPSCFLSDTSLLSFHALWKIKCLVENQLNQLYHKIKQIKTNGGGECSSLVFEKYLADHCIFTYITWSSQLKMGL